MLQIECKDLSLGYEGVAVCENLNFSVNAGDYLCIVGNNGSGKSTLMKALLRLKTPDSGEIRLGEGISQSDIGYLPQRNEAQSDFPATVLEVVRSGFTGKKRFFPRLTGEEKRAAERHMRCMNISDLSGRPFSALSGGQQQRALLARALCAAERILLLDEPVSGLDVYAAKDMYAAIDHLNRGHGTTIIMITHDLSAVEMYATKVLCMSEAPVFYENPEDYLRSRSFERKGDGGNA